MRLRSVSAAACLLVAGCSGEAPKGSSWSASSPTACVGDSCGVEQAPRTEPATPVGGVGSTLRFPAGRGAGGTVTLLDLRRIPLAEGREAFRVAPPVSGSFLVVEVSVVIEEGFGIATASTFQIRSLDGITHRSVLGVTEDGVNGSRLEPGERSRGEVAFDVPQGEWLIDYRVSGAPLATFRVVA